MEMSNSKWIGVDGCKAGWFSIGLDDDGNDEMNAFATFGELVEHYRSAELILVDIPFGLPAKRGGRLVDFEARRLLEFPRSSSVFPVPVRQAIEYLQQNVDNIVGAREINKEVTGQRLSQQTWGIARKIAEVDLLIRSSKSQHVMIREVHPELLFWASNSCTAMAENKNKAEGLQERLATLEKIDPRSRAIADAGWAEFRGQGVAVDDILDALAAALTAWECHDHLRTIPGEEQLDSHRLPMEMVFCDWEHNE